MDIMLILQIIVLLGAIFIGVRLGGIGIGYAGGAGVLVLGLCLGMKPGNIPWDVILIITSVIAAISAMQLAGGLEQANLSGGTAQIDAECVFLHSSFTPSAARDRIFHSYKPV